MWWSLLVSLLAVGLGLLVTLGGLPILRQHVGLLPGDDDDRLVRAVFAYVEGVRGP